MREKSVVTNQHKGLTPPPPKKKKKPALHVVVIALAYGKCLRQ